jgi:hypothetical protein
VTISCCSPKLGDDSLPVVRDCLLSIFADVLHPGPETASCRGDMKHAQLENAEQIDSNDIAFSL